jgi:hypothetical protein
MPGAEPIKYQQRRPEKTVLYRIFQRHLEGFLEHAHESSGKRLPKYVENEFRGYLECGLHAHGFARAVCETCGDELLLPFSCKLRGICPFCNTRRMSNTAAHLMDHVIAPDVTLRQWVLTVPFELRLLLAAKPDALSAIGRIFIQEIQRWQRQRAQALIVPDALFLPDATGERVDTLKHRAPTRIDVEEIVTSVATRCVRWLEKRGYLRGEGDDDPAENADSSDTDSPWMRCLRGSLGVVSYSAGQNAEPAPLASSHDAAEELRFTRLSRLAWATLYQRVFEIDPLACSSCGGRMRFVEVIEDVGRARSELRRRNLPAEPPPLSRARSPDGLIEAGRLSEPRPSYPSRRPSGGGGPVCFGFAQRGSGVALSPASLSRQSRDVGILAKYRCRVDRL